MFTTAKRTAMDARRHKAKKALLYAKRKYRGDSSPAKMDPAMLMRQQEFDEIKLLLLEWQLLLADQDKKEKVEEKQEENLNEEERAASEKANEERKDKVAIEKRRIIGKERSPREKRDVLFLGKMEKTRVAEGGFTYSHNIISIYHPKW